MAEGLHSGWETAGVVFVVDDLTAWLVGLLADAGRKKLTTLVLNLAQLGRELGQQHGPCLRPARLPDDRQGHREQPPAAWSVARTGRADLTAEGWHRRRVDRREAQRQGADDVAQRTPWQRSGEQDVHVAAAARRDVSEDMAAAAGDEPAERLGLSADLGREDSATLTMVPDGYAPVVNVNTDAA
jgi:hypothetical protein